jgi:deoxyribonuclease I
MQLAAFVPTVATTPASATPAIAAAAPAADRQAAALAAESASDLDRRYAPAQGKEGAALLRSLHLITRTGHVDRGYATARDELFGDIADLDRDNHIEDLFTGERRGPITGRRDAFDRGLNTEHTWPQSKGATGVAQSDLHHLYPADMRTNERRGSLPYGDVVRVEWTVGEGARQARLGADALGRQVFEPRADMKGDVARGLLYFYTRYSQSRPSRFTLDNFRHELPTLLRWHEADPVSGDERARNDAIQRVQGNRNPFIDRPEFVGKVGFDKLKPERS